MGRYQWLLFDADGTLFDYDKAESAALCRAFQSTGVAFDASYLTAYRHFNGALWKALEKGEVTQEIIKVRRFELLFEAIEVAYPPATFSALYLDCLAECAELIEDAADVLRALQANYRMAILTNGLTTVQRGRLTRSPIRQHIAEMIISEEIGFSKPAPEFFDSALARLGKPSRHELLMIGDNWTADIMGAMDYGLDACWYNPERKPRPNVCKITREIASLRELVEWLK